MTHNTVWFLSLVPFLPLSYHSPFNFLFYLLFLTKLAKSLHFTSFGQQAEAPLQHCLITSQAFNIWALTQHYNTANAK